MVKNKVNVTACIVTYNNIGCIKPCLESIYRETKGINLKLFISDNCSTDGTVELIQSEFPQAHLIQNEKNGGFGYGHNKVLPLIHSKYHAVINPDIHFEEDALTGLIEYMENHPEVGMITPKILNPDGTEQFLPKEDPSIRYVILSKFPFWKKFRRQYTRQDENLQKPTRINSCTGCFFVIRTDLFKKLKGFDHRFFMYYEDADLSRRARQHKQLIFDPEVAAYHDWKRDNMKSLKGIRIFLHSMTKYFSKWKWRF